MIDIKLNQKEFRALKSITKCKGIRNPPWTGKNRYRELIKEMKANNLIQDYDANIRDSSGYPIADGIWRITKFGISSMRKYKDERRSTLRDSFAIPVLVIISAALITALAKCILPQVHQWFSNIS